MKKKISILLTIAMVIGLLAGCGGKKEESTTEEGEGSKLIGVCMQNMSSSISELQAQAMKDMFEPMGYEVQIASADDNVSKQTEQVQGFILMDAEMIVVLPCQIETLEDSLIEAREAGIKVVISGGTGTISEDAYDAVSCDDEYMIGMYVASVAKTYSEEYMDPKGDWDVAFISSTISDDAKSRCLGETQIIEPYLRNKDGDYVNLVGEVVEESEKIENPVYCEMVADRVENLADCTTEMDISGDNRSVVAGVLTDNPKARVIIGYNSLVSTAGSQYVMDSYPEEEQKEFAFFSAGVMGDEYEYLIGSVAEDAGTKSVFRAACQFGGGDAAGTLANLANAVLTGEEGVDYGKSNPNSIGLYFPIAADKNNGTASLVCFDTSSKIEYFTYDQILKHDKLMVYWDSENGYNESMKEEAAAGMEGLPDMENEAGETPEGAPEGAEKASGTAADYTCELDGAMGKETLQISLGADGICQFSLPGNPVITDVYAGTYTQDGTTVTIKGLKNVDESSEHPVPGLWSFIDSSTGDCVITIDESAKTFTPVE